MAAETKCAVDAMEDAMYRAQALCVDSPHVRAVCFARDLSALDSVLGIQVAYPRKLRCYLERLQTSKGPRVFATFIAADVDSNALDLGMLARFRDGKQLFRWAVRCLVDVSAHLHPGYARGHVTPKSGDAQFAVPPFDLRLRPGPHYVYVHRLLPAGRTEIQLPLAGVELPQHEQEIAPAFSVTHANLYVHAALETYAHGL